MFGYATDETEECMPLTVVLSHALNKKIAELRRSGDLWWARPDSKTQVTCEYRLVSFSTQLTFPKSILTSTKMKGSFQLLKTLYYRFDNGACVPIRVHTVVVSVQHSEQVTLPVLRDEIMAKVVKEVIPDKYLDNETKYHINPCGNFIIGGPMGDAGTE